MACNSAHVSETGTRALFFSLLRINQYLLALNSQPIQCAMSTDLERLKKLAAERKLSGDIISRLDAVGTKPPAQKNAAQEEPTSGAKSTGGIKLPVRIMKYEQKRGKKMPYTDYELMICRSFGTMKIPPNEGELATENELKLRIPMNSILRRSWITLRMLWRLWCLVES
jgi:hypothetical protein